MLSITNSTAVRTALLLAAAGAALLLTARSTAAQETVTIAVGDIWFCDASYRGVECEITIHAGDTVVWDFSSAQAAHTTTECGASCDDPTASPRWDSGVISDGSSYQYTLAEPGTYLFLCRIHPTLQRGRIVVLALEPTSTRQPATAEQTPRATATPPPELPHAGQGGASDSGGRWLVAGVALATSVTLALGGAALLRSGRRRRS